MISAYTNTHAYNIDYMLYCMFMHRCVQQRKLKKNKQKQLTIQQSQRIYCMSMNTNTNMQWFFKMKNEKTKKSHQRTNPKGMHSHIKLVEMSMNNIYMNISCISHRQMIFSFGLSFSLVFVHYCNLFVGQHQESTGFGLESNFNICSSLNFHVKI